MNGPPPPSPGGCVPVSALEFVWTRPTDRVIFDCAWIIHIFGGEAEIVSAEGRHLLRPGTSYSLGSGRSAQLTPRGPVRAWAIFVDESFLRAQMSWVLFDRQGVREGVHPQDWDGGPLLLEPGMAMLSEIEPLWRQMSMLRERGPVAEFQAAHSLELFARWVRIALPVFFDPSKTSTPPPRVPVPIKGRLTDTSAIGHVGRAVDLLRQRLNEPWTVPALAREVCLSRTHLTRLFAKRTGATPMRFLAEIRLVEFTRLVDETDLPIGSAATAVGWSDPRVASARFTKRFGMTPTQYRETPHPRHHVSAPAT